jgi:hypothetical protein
VVSEEAEAPSEEAEAAPEVVSEVVKAPEAPVVAAEVDSAPEVDPEVATEKAQEVETDTNPRDLT